MTRVFTRRSGQPGHPARLNGNPISRNPGICIALLVLAAVFVSSTGCIGMLKIANETGNKPAGTEDRAALLQQIIRNTEEEEQATAASPVLPDDASASPQKLVLYPDSLKVRQEYIYGDREHEMHAMVTNVTLLPFYFWWFIDYNKFVVEQPTEGNQFLVVFVRFEDRGTKTALVPSAEVMPVVYKDTIYMHRPYFNTSVLSSYQRNLYGTSNEFSVLPYQWIREIGQDKRDYAFLTGYYAIGVGNTTADDSDDSATNTSTSSASYATMCRGSLSLPSESGQILTREITDGQCPGYFIRPGASNAIEGYLIYEVPETLDLKHTYLYGLFNRYSWTRWRLG